MAVYLGKIKLIGVQNLYTEEARTLVEQRVPEQQGSVFQDMGREPITLVLEGLLLGEEALSTLETLRDAQLKAKPLSFAADIAVGSELTEVVIEDFKARQVAGYSDRLRFSMRLREHVKPPQSKQAKTKPVDQSSKKAAKDWDENTVAAADTVANPETVPDALAKNPELLDHMDTEELGASVGKNLDTLSTDQVGDITQSVAKIDPQKNIGVLKGVKKSGKLSQFVSKFINGSKNAFNKLKAALKKIDVNKLKGLAKSLYVLVTSGMDALKKLKEVKTDAMEVYNNSKGISFSWQEVKTEGDKEYPMAKTVVSLKKLLKTITEFLAEKATQELPKIAKNLSIQKLFFKLVDMLNKTCLALNALFKRFASIDAIVASIGLASPVISGVANASKGSQEYLKDMDLKQVDDTNFKAVFSAFDSVIDKVDEFFKQGIDRMENILERLGVNKLPGLCKQLDGLSEGLLALKKIPDSKDKDAMDQGTQALVTV